MNSVASKNLVTRQVYDQAGKQVSSSLNVSSNGLPSKEHAAKLASECFREMNDIPWSPGIAAAAVEIVGAGALLKCFPGPATWVNFLTTVGETSSVFISRLDSFSQEAKNGALAWFQVLSGIFGFVGVAKETFKNEEERDFSEVPVWEKVSLSVASLLNVFTMASGAVEKSLLAMVCKNRGDKEEEGKQKNGNESRASLTSALSDRRCCVEWSMMIAIPWISNIGPLKKILDVFIPYRAIGEGLDTFVEEPEAMMPFSESFAKNQVVQKIMKTISDPFSLFVNDENNNGKKYNLCWPFKYFLKFLIGTQSDKNGPGQSGFRNYCLKPVFKILGCGNLPLYYLNQDEQVVVEFKS